MDTTTLIGGLLVGGGVAVYAIYRIQVFKSLFTGSRSADRAKAALADAITRGDAIDAAAAELRARESAQAVAAPAMFELVKVHDGADNPDTPDNYAVVVLRNVGGKATTATATSPHCEVHVGPPDFGPGDDVHLTLTDITSGRYGAIRVSFSYENSAGSPIEVQYEIDRQEGTIREQ